MNQVKLKELIKEKKVVIPMYFLSMYKELQLNINEFVLLLYLYDKDGTVFNPTMIANDLKEEMLAIMESISNLTDKGLIKINTIKDERGIMEEILDLNPLYEMIMLHLMSELNTLSDSEENIHHLIEKAFGRRLTPSEHEIIDDWDKNGYNKDLIKEAINETNVMGIDNLRYIDKILFDWSKQGIKVPEDIKKEEKKEEVTEMYSCDWLNDDDEEI